MREDEAAEQRPQLGSSSSSVGVNTKDGSGAGFEAAGNRGGKYKFLWALVAIVLLAFCSVVTASLVLNLSPSAFGDDLKHDFDPKIKADLDVLDLEEREKTVKQMWNLYQNSNNNIGRLRSFWRDAFGAGYEELTSDVPSVRDAALVDIARMSFRSRVIYDPPPSGKASKAQVGPKLPVRQTRKV